MRTCDFQAHAAKENTVIDRNEVLPEICGIHRYRYYYTCIYGGIGRREASPQIGEIYADDTFPCILWLNFSSNGLTDQTVFYDSHVWWLKRRGLAQESTFWGSRFLQNFDQIFDQNTQTPVFLPRMPNFLPNQIPRITFNCKRQTTSFNQPPAQNRVEKSIGDVIFGLECPWHLKSTFIHCRHKKSSNNIESVGDERLMSVEHE